MNAEAIHNTSIWHMGRSFISYSLISWPPMSTKGEQKGQLNPLKKAREQTGRKQIQTNTGQQNLNRVVKVRPQNPLEGQRFIGYCRWIFTTFYRLQTDEDKRNKQLPGHKMEVLAAGWQAYLDFS